MSDDLISRQVLKQAMYHEAFEVDSELQKWDGGCWIRYKLFEKTVDSMPSVQPKQKTGQWISNRHTDTVLCSECKKCYGDVSKFCPNCGAKLESED